jgi:hypothetical protein
LFLLFYSFARETTSSAFLTAPSQLITRLSTLFHLLSLYLFVERKEKILSSAFFLTALSQLITRRFQPAQASKLMKFVAFPSSIVASCSNCYIMRRPEIESGVLLQDKVM